MLLLLVVLPLLSTSHACIEKDVRLYNETASNEGPQGAVELCYNQTWRPVCASNVNHHEASIICGQRGYSSYGTEIRVSSNTSFLSGIDLFCIRGDERTVQECHSRLLQFRCPIALLTCPKNNCTDNSLRLVGGVSYREGRVEVCVGGRWGTVCSEGWTESDAGNVCSRLGYPSTDAMISFFGEGTGLVYSLVFLQLQSANESDGSFLARSNCDHSMDLGVRCQSHSEACAEINEALSSLTTMPMEDNTVTVTWSTVLGLGAFAGLTNAALIAVIASWIITCIYQRKFKVQLIEDINEQQSPQTNAVYDYINENEAPPTVSCDLTSNEAYHSVQCVTNDSYSVVPQ